MNVERMDRADRHIDDFKIPETDGRVPTTREVLEELFHLLEDYAPTWYTQQHHNRAVAALLGRPL